MNKFIDFIVKHAKYVVLAFLIITIPLGYYASNQSFLNHVDKYFNEDDIDHMFYKNFQETFGNEEIAVIVFKADDIFTNENIDIIRKISELIDKSTGVQRVYSLTQQEEANGENDEVKFNKVVPIGILSSKTLKEVKIAALSNKTIINKLLSPDGKTTAIMIELEPVSSIEIKTVLLKKIEADSKIIAGKKVQLRFSGSPFVEAETNSLSQKDFWTFTPFTFLIIFLIIAFLLKNYYLALICQIDLLFTLIWGIGLFVFFGETFDMTTTMIPPVLLAIAVADSVHVLTHFKELLKEGNLSYVDTVRSSIKSLWLPCLFTSITTGIGFLSFATSTIRPAKMVGIYTALGITVAYLMTVTFLPGILILFQRKISEDKIQSFLEKKEKENSSDIEIDKQNLFTRILMKSSMISTNYYKPLSLLFFLIMVFTVLGISKISFETNFINYLPDDSSLRKDVDFIEKNLGGTIPFELIINAKSKQDSFTKSGNLKVIEKIQSDLTRDIEKFSTSFSIADYFKEINRAFNNNIQKFYRIPEKDIDIMDFYEIGDSEVLDRIMSPNKMQARISFQSRWGSNQLAGKINDRVKNYLKQNLPADKFTYKFTGMSTLYLTMGDNLQKSQRTSFTLTFIVIFIMMFFVAGKSIKLAFISMIPNLFPIFLTIGIMGWLKIPLDISTIMISSVTLGIAVDDTIHFIVWFKRGLTSGKDTKAAIHDTFLLAGKPIVITSLVLFAGFFILILGSIKPTQTFGILTALSMLFALIGDLIFLPALLMLFKVKK